MSLLVRDVSLSYGPTQVLRDCSLRVADGELACLVGPSGCGKTSLLNVIAGLIAPDGGHVEIGGYSVDRLPTRERKLAFVMDRLGLYPHLSVFENIAYPLRIRAIPAHRLQTRVLETCRLVGLIELENRRPHQLSAGQQQRVAIARALVRDDAALLLADECFSNLDAQLRHELRRSFHRWQRERGVTSLFVTHDQEEALALGDRVLLMRDGRIEQAGSPSELYGDPRTIFAATFFGIPRCNVVAAANGDNALNSFGKYAALARPELLPAHRAPSSVSLAFRPEAVIIVEPSRSGAIPLKVDWVEAIGPDSIVCLNGDHFVTARVRGSPNLAGGSIVGIHIQQERLMAFDTVSGGRIG